MNYIRNHQKSSIINSFIIQWGDIYIKTSFYLLIYNILQNNLVLMQKNQQELKQQQKQQQNQQQTQSKDQKQLTPEEIKKKEARALKKQEDAKRKQMAKEKKTQVPNDQKPVEPKQAKEGKQRKNKEKKEGPSAQYVNLVNSQQIKNQKYYQSKPVQGQNNVLITSALPYVNNVPHLGNLIGCVLSADVFARFKRLVGDNTLYICGTDEYGSATVVKALLDKMTPREICDKYFQIHSDIYKWFDISFDYFGRTSTDWHSKITQEIFEALKNNKYMKKETIQQAYCPKCDLFLADRFVVGTCPQKDCNKPGAKGDQCDVCGKPVQDPMDLINPQCYVCKTTPIVKDTEHYFLELTDIQKQLQEWVDLSSVQGSWSSNSTSIAKSWLKQGLKPKCITRDISWGVPVPGQQKKVFYVWFDAPIGYISITANLLQDDYKSWWKNPKDVKLYQFMGKDNVPFHTVMFPASLIGTKQNWTLLHHISTTQYLNYEQGKFSKSKGTGVFGDDAIKTGIPSDVWRYYLLINRPQKSDSNFYWTDLADKNNNQLVANIGNICNRALDFVYNHLEKKIPRIEKDKLAQNDLEFLESVHQKFTLYIDTLNKIQIKDGLRIAMAISSLGNKYLQDSEFWEQKAKQSGRTLVVMAIIINFIRLLSAIFQPYLPQTSAKINFFLGLSDRTERDRSLLQYLADKSTFVERFLKLTEDSKGMEQPIVLFQKITDDQVKEFKLKFGEKEQEKDQKKKAKAKNVAKQKKQKIEQKVNQVKKTQEKQEQPNEAVLKTEKVGEGQ